MTPQINSGVCDQIVLGNGIFYVILLMFVNLNLQRDENFTSSYRQPNTAIKNVDINPDATLILVEYPNLTL